MILLTIITWRLTPCNALYYVHELDVRMYNGTENLNAPGFVCLDASIMPLAVAVRELRRTLPLANFIYPLRRI